MKKGDVLVDRKSALTFYTIITSINGKYAGGVTISIDNKGNAYQVNLQGMEDTEFLDGQILLALPDELPVAANAESEAQ